MKPATKKALDLISRPIGACPTTFLNAGVGVRYGARLHELREADYRIVKTRCDIPGHHHPKPVIAYRLEP